MSTKNELDQMDGILAIQAEKYRLEKIAAVSIPAAVQYLIAKGIPLASETVAAKAVDIAEEIILRIDENFEDRLKFLRAPTE